MLSEENLMRILEFEPQFSIHFLGMLGAIRPVSFAKTVLETIAIVLNIFLFVPNILLFDSILNFVVNMLWFTLFPAAIVYLATILGDNTVIYKETVEVDAQLDTHIAAERDWWLLIMAALYPCLTGTMIADTWFNAIRSVDIPYYAMILVCFSVMSVAVKKRLISKRIKHLRTAERFMDRVEDTILISRRLLHLDNTLNSTYGPLATLYIIFTFQDVLINLYCNWVYYGAGLLLFFSNVIGSNVRTLYVFFECVVCVDLALSSSMIANEVNELKLELDITLTARSVTKSEEELIYMYLMEHRHSPVGMSGAGLFDISLSSVSVVCAIMVSYMLVVIQYT